MSVFRELPCVCQRTPGRLIVIFFIRSGRLGNQLFQYFGLASMRRANEHLILYGFDDLRTTFDGVEATIIRRSRRAEQLIVLAESRRVAQRSPGPGRPDLGDSRRQREALSRIQGGVPKRAWRGFIGRVGEDDAGIAERDAASRYVLGTNAYFENASNIDDALLGRLRFRSEVMEQAKNFLSDVGLATRGFAFLHLRLGDLAEHAPAMAWIASAVTALREDRPSLPIIIASNDCQQAQSLAESGNELFVSGLDAGADLALMSLADAGILSVGTFGWWGARLAAEQAQGPFIAPSSNYGRACERWSNLGRLQLRYLD